MMEDLAGMIQTTRFSVVLSLCLVQALKTCEMHCHRASMEDGLVSCVGHRHSYPEIAESAESKLARMD